MIMQIFNSKTKSSNLKRCTFWILNKKCNFKTLSHHPYCIHFALQSSPDSKYTFTEGLRTIYVSKQLSVFIFSKHNPRPSLNHQLRIGCCCWYNCKQWIGLEEKRSRRSHAAVFRRWSRLSQFRAADIFNSSRVNGPPHECRSRVVL